MNRTVDRQTLPVAELRFMPGDRMGLPAAILQWSGNRVLLSSRSKTEVTGLVLLVLVSIAARFLTISTFPAHPISDFANLVEFARELHVDGRSETLSGDWQIFSPGMPLSLAGLFAMLPHADEAAVARWATASLTALLPLLPFLVWRNILPFGVRMAAGLALALWPGQVFYAGIAAQDNWALFPTIALGTLAVRALARPDRALPVAAGLLYAVGGAMRADTLITLLPLLLAAVRVDLALRRPRLLLAGALAALGGLCALAGVRYWAAGQFSVSLTHGAVSTLGAYLPGSSRGAWVPPYAYLAAQQPDLLRQHKFLSLKPWKYAVREALRRPGYHAARILAMLSAVAVTADADNLKSSLTDDGVLPPPLRQKAATLAARLQPLFRLELVLIHGLFAAALLIGIRRRHSGILILAGAVVLKYLYQGIGVILSRYLIVATALEILTIVVAAAVVFEMDPARRRRLLPVALPAGLLCAAALFLFAPRALAAVQKYDVDDMEQHSYRFHVESAAGAPMDCVMSEGVLISLWPDTEAAIRTVRRYPHAGDRAVAVCEVGNVAGGQPLVLEVSDDDGLADPGHMRQEVRIDGIAAYRNDIGDGVWKGKAQVPIPGGGRHSVQVEVSALQGDDATDWGDAGITTFRLSHVPQLPDLAQSRPATQSSTLPGSSGARAAVDGNTSGGYFAGSVTHTLEEASPWWQVDLGAAVEPGAIVVWNRQDCCAERLSDFRVFVSDQPFAPADTPETLSRRRGTWSSHQTAPPKPSLRIPTPGVKGRYVRVQLSGKGVLSLAEVQILPR
jgi:hypothetical protein